MTKLTPYSPASRDVMVSLLAAFYAEHYALSERVEAAVTPERLAAADEDLADWEAREDAALYLIEEDGASAGLLFLARHGGAVVWIENLFVRPEMRRRGIATRAIALAEEIARRDMHAPAISMDVIPQNQAAMRLYHALGYDTLQMITMRKPLGGAQREERTDLMGLPFRI